MNLNGRRALLGLVAAIALAAAAMRLPGPAPRRGSPPAQAAGVVVPEVRPHRVGPAREAVLRDPGTGAVEEVQPSSSDGEPAQTVRVRGGVLSSGDLRPVADAHVWLGLVGDATALAAGRTDSEGQFLLTALLGARGVHRSELLVRASSPGRGGATGVAPLEVERETGTHRCCILLLPCGTVRGRAAGGGDGDGQRAGVLVLESCSEARRLLPFPTVLDAATLARIVPTDAEGGFECLVRPGRVTVSALGADGTRGVPVAGEVLPGGVLDLGILAAPRDGRTIALRVLDERGVPVPGAFVLVEHPTLGAPIPRRVAGGIVAGDALGDDLGQVSLPALSADVVRVELVVGAPWHAPARLTVDLAEERVGRVSREVRLRRLPWVDVVIDAAPVRDMDWRVVEAVVVTGKEVRRPPSTRSAGEHATLIRGEAMATTVGPVRLDHGATWRALRRGDGEVVVRVALRGGASVSARVTPPADGETPRVHVMLPAGSVREVLVRAEDETLAARFPGSRGDLIVEDGERPGVLRLAPLWGLHPAIFVPEAARGIRLRPGGDLGGLCRAKEMPLPSDQRPVLLPLVADDFRWEGASVVRLQVVNLGEPARWARLSIHCVEGEAKGRRLTALPGEDGELTCSLPPGQYACAIHAGVRPVARREFRVVGSGAERVVLEVADRGP